MTILACVGIPESRWDDELLCYVMPCKRCGVECPVDTEFFERNQRKPDFPLRICRACQEERRAA